MPGVKVRESQFELLRLIAQFFIVTYHIFLFFIYPSTNDPLHKAIWLPLHIGVILFVLISGWFGIKPSVKSFVKLLTMMAMLYFPLQIMWIMKSGSNSIFEFATVPFFITCSPYWFMRTYIFLYLLSPLLNRYIEHSDFKQRLYLLVVLFIISHYVGSWGADASLLDGKNVVTFSFLYVLGKVLQLYKDFIRRLNNGILAIIYFVYNVIIVAVFTLYLPERGMNFIFVHGFFAYCSIGLLLNALLLFLIVAKLKFKSGFINLLGGASLTIYMFHGANLIIWGILSPVVDNFLLQQYENSLCGECILIAKACVISVIIILVSTVIHYCLYPIASKVGAVIHSKYDYQIR